MAAVDAAKDVRATSADVDQHGREEANMTPDGQPPTEYELDSLRRVSDKVPLSAWLVCVVEFAERFTYYGVAGPFQNYMQNSYDNPLRPGALGLGQANATTISYCFTFWMYLTPIAGGIIADSWLGRYRTICFSVTFYILGLFILFITSLPFSIEHGFALGGFITALILIGTGAGGIKSNVAVLIFEQYTETQPKIKTLETGERVIVDPQTTISNIYQIFYNVLCIGSLSGIPATYIELRVGFWEAYLVPFCVFWIAIAALAIGRKRYVRKKPQSVLPQVIEAFGIAIKNGFNMDIAKPSYQVELYGSSKVAWDDKFIEELKRGLYACRIFIPLPIAWLCYLQAANNLVSQAGAMETHGLPNDILFNFELLIEIILIHVLRTVVYPFLRKHHINFGPIARIVAGFLAGTCAIAWAAVVQKVVYSAGPCYDAPLACPESNGGAIPNHVHVMWQLPCYVLFALSEALFAISAAEYAYTKAPTSMKSLVAALNLFTVAIASALGIAVSRVAVDPHLTLMYGCLAGVYFLTTCFTWYFFRHYDKLEDDLFDLDAKLTKDGYIKIDEDEGQ